MSTKPQGEPSAQPAPHSSAPPHAVSKALSPPPPLLHACPQDPGTGSSTDKGTAACGALAALSPHTLLSPSALLLADGLDGAATSSLVAALVAPPTVPPADAATPAGVAATAAAASAGVSAFADLDSMKLLRMDARVLRGADGVLRVFSTNLRLGRLLGQGGNRGSVVHVATMRGDPSNAATPTTATVCHTPTMKLPLDRTAPSAPGGGYGGDGSEPRPTPPHHPATPAATRTLPSNSRSVEALSEERRHPSLGASFSKTPDRSAADRAAASYSPLIIAAGIDPPTPMGSPPPGLDLGGGGAGGAGGDSSSTGGGGLPFSRFAYKEYAQGTHMTKEEHLFSTSAYQLLLDNTPVTGRKRLVRHLVVPEAVVRDAGNGRDIGILMPIFSCSLHSALRHAAAVGIAVRPPTMPASASAPDLSSTEEESDEEPSAEDAEDDATSAFRNRRAFPPLTSCAVISGIVFQTLLGLQTLHTLPVAPVAALIENSSFASSSGDVSGLGGGGSGITTPTTPSHPAATAFPEGFSHNDLNLRNVLLDRATGRVAICDFELVHRLVPQRTRFRRSPPFVYTPPFGLYSRESDIWCLGLLVLELFTGIQPLLNQTITEDDFGNGPLRAPHSLPDYEGIPVIDWEANVAAHVQRLLGDAKRKTDTHKRQLSGSTNHSSSDSVLDSKGSAEGDAASSGDADDVDGRFGLLLRFCGRCLVNREGAQQPSCAELLTDPLFRVVQFDEAAAERIVAQWANGELPDA